MTPDTTVFTGRSRTSHAFRSAGFAIGTLAIAILVPPTPATAQETPAPDLLTVGHYLDMERVGDPQISPDGTQVIFTRSWVNKLDDRFDSELRIMDADGTRQRFLLKGSSPRWSPDGTRIAYLAPDDQDRPQIHVRWMDAEGATTQVTRETEVPGNFRWSPDGTHIYFQRLVPHSDPWPIDLPPASGGRTVDPCAARHRPHPLPLRPNRLPSTRASSISSRFPPTAAPRGSSQRGSGMRAPRSSPVSATWVTT